MKRRIPLDRLEGAVILLVALIPFLSMDAFLHRRTQASIAGLSSHLASHACVVRDGAETLVDATAVVAGELVLLQAGEFLPADGMLVQADNLHQRPPACRRLADRGRREPAGCAAARPGAAVARFPPMTALSARTA